MSDHLLATYNALNVSFTHGQGSWLFDANGKRYLDSLSGIAVTNLGHNYPTVTQAIQCQAEKLLHTSQLVQIPQQIALSNKLYELTNLDKVFFCNSGAESVEGLIKLARLYGHSKGIDLPKIIVMENAFHGRTMATLSAGGNRKYHVGFEPLVGGFVRAPYNDIAALEKIASQSKDIVAILCEPIQGEGGVLVPNPSYLIAVRELCDKNNWLMMLDEIQTGMGRTGKLFAHHHNGIVPDAMSIAKGLGNGVPIGAFLVKSPYCDLFHPGTHGSTFGGNPMATSAALATLNAITEHKFWENATLQGEKIVSALKEGLKNNPRVKDVRGKGLMMGVELDAPCRDILNKALDKGIIFNIAGTNTLRLLPPININNEEVDILITTVLSIIQEYTNRL